MSVRASQDPYSMPSPTRIIRFVSDDDQTYMGEEPAPGALATVLTGSLYDGTLARTDIKKVVSKLLSPIVPTDIFCIGLNYMKHYEESAKKRGIALPSQPVIFMKPSTALVHPGDDVWMPQIEYGPVLVTAEEIPDPQQLQVMTRINGAAPTVDVPSC